MAKLSGGRSPLHHHQDLSPVRFIDLFDRDRYNRLTITERGVSAQLSFLDTGARSLVLTPKVNAFLKSV